MTEKHKQRELYRSWKNTYYHLSSDGWKNGRLFNTVAQYAYGMTLIGLIHLRFGLTIYSFSLMPNHFHILLSGTGMDCVAAFDYLKRKINARLVMDGNPSLPLDYWFKLTPVDTPEQMKANYIYIDRNAYELQYCVPGGYLWSSCYVYYSKIIDLFMACPAASFSKRKLEQMTGSRIIIPDDWQFHPVYGLLPSSFIEQSLFYRLFPNPKEYQTHLVKDYEAFAKIADSLEESFIFSKEEREDLVQKLLWKLFHGKRLKELSGNEKGKLAVIMVNQYKIPVPDIAIGLNMSEKMINQFLRSKDYGRGN